MTSRDFCYWLQGFFEVSRAGKREGYMPELDAEQVDMVQKHLNMVFYHEIDPSMGDKEHQGKLQALHQGQPITLTSEVSDSSIVEQESTVNPHWKERPYDGGMKYRC